MFNEISKVEKKSEQPFNFENWLSLELPKQYDEKVKILRKLGLLEVLPDAKDYGIIGIDGKEYVLPEMEEIREAIEKNKEVFETKMKQGLTDLNIVPFGSPLEKLIKIMEKTIIKHHQEGKLFTAKKNLEDENEPLQKLELHPDCEINPEHSPLYVWKEGYKNADTENKIVYYPQEFSGNHQGQTKREILSKTKRGFIITLHEKNPNIPKENANEIINGRKRLEANKTSNDYLKMLQTEKQYQNEQGQIPEEWISKFLTTLEKYDQVIDDYNGNGKASFQVGAYFLSSDDVPYCYWDRDNRRARLSRNFPRFQFGYSGARFSARVL
jgi:hypothetical protein